MNNGLRICFMGTPAFAVESLSQITASRHAVVCVVTAPDKPAGRGRKLQESEVKKFALKNNLPIVQPTHLRDEEFLSKLAAVKPDVIVVVAFRMLPKEVWSLPRYGTFNLHASLLPKYRGAAPIHWAIINGEQETGVTTFFIDEKIDTGHLIHQAKTKIKKDETVGDLYHRLMLLGGDLVIKTLDAIEQEGEGIPTYPQPSEDINSLPPAPKLTKENTQLPWNSSCEAIYNFVRGLNPFPTAWTTLVTNEQEMHIKILKTSYQLEEHTNQPGKIRLEKGKLGVYTQDGIQYLEELKPEGKRAMPIRDFLNGQKFENDFYFQ